MQSENISFEGVVSQFILHTQSFYCSILLISHIINTYDKMQAYPVLSLMRRRGVVVSVDCCVVSCGVGLAPLPYKGSVLELENNLYLHHIPVHVID